jgi:pimeloyl-ACP methyl ester carboxylesterase
VVIDEYERAYRTLGCLRGMLGYYRAVLEDMEQNREFGGCRLTTPVLALGGDVGSAPDIYDAMQAYAADVRGGLVADCGHYIPEEQPAALAQEMLAFFQAVVP